MKVYGDYVVFDDEESLGNLREISDEASVLTNKMVKDAIEKIKKFYEETETKERTKE